VGSRVQQGGVEKALPLASMAGGTECFAPSTKGHVANGSWAHPHLFRGAAGRFGDEQLSGTHSQRGAGDIQRMTDSVQSRNALADSAVAVVRRRGCARPLESACCLLNGPIPVSERNVAMPWLSIGTDRSDGRRIGRCRCADRTLSEGMVGIQGQERRPDHCRNHAPGKRTTGLGEQDRDGGRHLADEIGGNHDVGISVVIDIGDFNCSRWPRHVVVSGA